MHFISFENWRKHCKESHYRARNWHAKHVGIQLQKNIQIGHLKLDTHVIVRRLRDIMARGEPITIKDFVIDTINPIIYYQPLTTWVEINSSWLTFPATQDKGVH